MKTKTILALASLALLAVALMLWFRAARTKHRLEETLSQHQAQRAELLRELREAERRRPLARAAEHAPVSAAKATTAGAIAPPSPPAPASALPQELPPPERTRNDTMASDPEAQVLWLQRVRAKAVLAYGEFFHRRNLSPSQIERFLENKLRFDELALDLGMAVAPSDTAGKSAARTLRERGKADHEAAQRATLGSEHYEALLEYERTAWTRNAVVNALAGGAALAGLPLTAEQGDRLLKAAVAAAGNDTTTSGEALVRQIDWELLDALAQQILTLEQFAFYRTAAPPSGYSSRWEYQIDAAVARAQQAEADKRSAKPDK